MSMLRTMVPSVQIANAVRPLPAAAGLSSTGSGTSAGTEAPANFHSVLRHYHLASDEETEADDAAPNSETAARSATSAARARLSKSNSLRSASLRNLPVTANAKTPSAASFTSRQETEIDGTSAEDAPSSSMGLQHTPVKNGSSPQPAARSNGEAGSGSQETMAAAQSTAVPLIPLNTFEALRMLAPLTSSLTWRQEGDSAQSAPAAPPESAAEAEIDSAASAPPQLPADDSSAPSGSLAFAARLMQNPAPASNADTSEPAANLAPAAKQSLLDRTAVSSNTPTLSKQSNTQGDLSSGPGDTGTGDPSPKQSFDPAFVKPETDSSPNLAASSLVPATAALFSTPAPPAAGAPPSARMDEMIDPPAVASGATHDITVRIPDAADQSTAVRFVERGGEIHVSVRTTDTEMAQTLRGGLTDLVGRLHENGIQTELWQPGSGASSSQGNSQHLFADPDGSKGNSSSSGSNSEQESNQQNKPRWVEELEESIGNLKETAQLWQA